MSAADEEKTLSDSGDKDAQRCYPCYCTFAFTGERKTYQAIFVCRTCSSSSEALLCVCEACANHCHEAELHDEVEYLGTGYAYCDCNVLGQKSGCKLIQESERNVSEGKISVGGGQYNLPLLAVEKEGDPQQYVMDVYTIPELYKNEAPCRDLVEAACLLVKDSKETFWLNNDQDRESWCCLERMAWRIFNEDKSLYDLDIQKDGGAEWWVQVKKNIGKAEDPKGPSGSAAVDLHYDKDEELAEKYGLGSFPVLSTVTYLTGGFSSNPTVILGRTYEQPDDEVISDMLVSHPVLGKHLVFDGRLLHGAPSAELHKKYLAPDEEKKLGVPDVRVTLLVNIWANRKPAGVHPLNARIRSRVNSNLPAAICDQWMDDALKFQKQTIQHVVLEEQEGEEDVLGRIELPFVCKGITWESEDDESSGLVVVTCPPPEHEGDSVHVRFGPGVQAYLDHPQGVTGQNIRNGNSDDLAYEEAYI